MRLHVGVVIMVKRQERLGSVPNVGTCFKEMDGTGSMPIGGPATRMSCLTNDFGPTYVTVIGACIDGSASSDWGRQGDLLAPIHDRIPVILDSDDEALWLDPGPIAPVKVLPCLRPFPLERLEAIPVSALVSSPGNEGPELVEPVPA